jgi:hypothetical protein
VTLNETTIRLAHLRPDYEALIQAECGLPVDKDEDGDYLSSETSEGWTAYIEGYAEENERQLATQQDLVIRAVELLRQFRWAEPVPNSEAHHIARMEQIDEWLDDVWLEFSY